MTTEEVYARLDAIRAVTTDDELAHSEEDGLHRDVLASIADLNGVRTIEEARTLARLALKTQEMDFARWCA